MKTDLELIREVARQLKPFTDRFEVDGEEYRIVENEVYQGKPGEETILLKLE